MQLLEQINAACKRKNMDKFCSDAGAILDSLSRKQKNMSSHIKYGRWGIMLLNDISNRQIFAVSGCSFLQTCLSRFL